MEFLSPDDEQRALVEDQLSMLPGKKQHSKRQNLSGFLSPREYARRHGVHPHTVLNWIRAGKIPAISRPCGEYIRYLIPENVKPPMRRLIDRR